LAYHCPVADYRSNTRAADPDRAAAHNPSTNSLKLLRQARERLGEGLRAVEAGNIAESDRISLRNR
jgi:hypothetical protein